MKWCVKTPVCREEVKKTIGLKFYARITIQSPAVSSQWPCTVSCLMIKCLVGSSLDFSNAGRQTDFPASVIKRLQKTHYKNSAVSCTLYLCEILSMQEYAITHLLLLFNWLCLFLWFLLSLAASVSTVEGPVPKGHSGWYCLHLILCAAVITRAPQQKMGQKCHFKIKPA